MEHKDSVRKIFNTEKESRDKSLFSVQPERVTEGYGALVYKGLRRVTEPWCIKMATLLILLHS